MALSEVAQILRKIDLEFKAAKNGLPGLAQGTSQHTFIHEKLERTLVYEKELATYVGPAEAKRMVYERYAQTMDS